MPGLEGAGQVVREWIAKAEEDLKAAAHILKLGRSCPTAAVCFHAQQCAEKYLKAYLVSQAIAFPKTHKIQELVLLTPAKARPSISLEEQLLLSNYAAGPRYPGWREVPLPEARLPASLLLASYSWLPYPEGISRAKPWRG